MKVLIVVDMQEDFVNGSLKTEEAALIVPRVADKIKSFQGEVLFTRDTHQEDYLSTQEGRMLPVSHCIEGTKGWELVPEIEALRTSAPIDKPTFGSTRLGEVLAEKNSREPLESVTLIGLCTDICVISNALLVKAYLPEVPIFVDASCCAGVTPDSHSNALKAMKACQIHIIND